MAKLEKQEITREVLLSDSVNDWQDVVYRYEEARRKGTISFGTKCGIKTLRTNAL